MERDGTLDISGRSSLQHEVMVQSMEGFGEDGQAQNVDQK